MTTVSRSLKAETIQVLKTRKQIEVIYTFYRPKPPRKGRAEVRRALRVREGDFLLSADVTVDADRLIVGVWIVAQLFILPKHAQGYRPWLSLGIILVPLSLIFAIATW